jgi:hypothetical protein
VGLALFLAYQVGMWFYAYRDDEGHIGAAVAGLGLAGPAIAALILPEMTDEPLPLSAVFLFGYLSLSHFAYAIANWNLRRASWLDGL